MAVDGESFPSIGQALIYIGAGVATVVAWVIGGRKKNGETVSERDDRLAAIERELADRKNRDANERERAQTDRDLAELKRDIEKGCEKVIEAVRVSLELQLKDMNSKLVGVRKRLGRLEHKQPK